LNPASDAGFNSSGSFLAPPWHRPRRQGGAAESAAGHKRWRNITISRSSTSKASVIRNLHGTKSGFIILLLGGNGDPSRTRPQKPATAISLMTPEERRTQKSASSAQSSPSGSWPQSLAYRWHLEAGWT
jgi:hypothetical protein